MTVIAVALAGAIGAVSGFLVAARQLGKTGGRRPRWFFPAIVGAMLGFTSGVVSFHVFGSNDVGQVAASMLGGYLAGALSSVVMEILDGDVQLDRVRAVVTARDTAVGSLCLALGLALASQL